MRAGHQHQAIDSAGMIHRQLKRNHPAKRQTHDVRAIEL